MSSRRRSDFKSSGYRARTVAAIRAQRSAQAQAAYMIKRNPVLRGNARTSSNYSGNYRYGRSSNPELKFFDNAISTSTPTAGTVSNQLLTIPQDATQSGRVGRKIVVRKIVCNLTALINGTGTAAAIGSDRVRFVLVLDKQANGAACDWASVGNGVFTAANVDALRNLDNVQRFKIIKDWDLALNCTSGVSGAWNFQAKAINFVHNCAIPIEYDGSVTTGAIGSIRSNNLCLLVIGTTVNNGASLQGTIRIRYTDN